MPITRRQFVATTASGLLLPPHAIAAAPKATDRELIGKTICGYQGWFNAEADGRGLGFRHYQGKDGRFVPGNCTIDLWPDVSELGAAERFDTAFRHADGSTAQVYSSAHPKTIVRHFDWMQAFGIDGVAIQRFGTSLRNDKIRKHHDEVIARARKAARRTGRLWMTMYDLSGMKTGEPQQRIADDWQQLVERQGVIEDATYLHHEGKPIVSLWGIGFSDGRKYTLNDCAELIDKVSMGGRCRVMLGTPYYWREQRRDALADEGLHDLFRKADIISPWAVGRFATPKDARRKGESHLAPDLAWCKNEGKHYLPVIFPGFSWHNLKKTKGISAKLDQIPRLGGQFLWDQAEAARVAGASSLYVAMFDEMDEATAIFKCTNDPPIGDSPFMSYKDLSSDHYLWLTGEIAKQLRRGVEPRLGPMPTREAGGGC